MSELVLFILIAFAAGCAVSALAISLTIDRYYQFEEEEEETTVNTLADHLIREQESWAVRYKGAQEWVKPKNEVT